MKPTLTFGSLFAGIGGIDLGLERAGMRCTWQVEIDDYATKVLAKHWPDVTRFRDVRTVGKHNLSRVDCIAGGFPCQPHSQAGERKASQDERDLWPEFYRLIRELEPRWVVAENVLGLLSSENGAFFGGILRDLAKAGYDARWQVLSAAEFGAPHLRERVILVAYYTGQRSGTRWTESAQQCGATIAVSDGSSDVAHTNGRGCRQTGQCGMGTTMAKWRNTTNDTPEAENASFDVAYANSDGGRRTQRANAGGMAGACGANTAGQGYSQWDADQCGGSPLAYASSPEWWTHPEEWGNVADWTNTGREEAASGLEFCCSELANPDRQSLAVGVGLAGNPFEKCTPAERDSDCADWAWAALPGMGRATSRVPSWLDRYHWPSGPGQKQYEWESPRVTTEKVANRTARLKGLGNAVVPALAEYVGRCIVAAEMAERGIVA